MDSLAPKKEIANAVSAFEQGRLSRRELVEGITALVVAAGAAGAANAQGLVRGAPTQVSDMGPLAAAAPFRPTGIDHISILVSDLQRSAEFYARLFSLRPVSEDIGYKILRLANDDDKIIVSLRQKEPYGAVDHYCFKVDNLDQEAATATFAEHGLTASTHIEYGYYVVDPDGAIVQLT
jgi:catechol 2,3-dioxygenase-like lactoylglutathione lyase family enzyme